MRYRNTRRAAAGLMIAALAVTAIGCGSSAASDAQPTSSATAAGDTAANGTAAENGALPDSVRKSGVLRVGTNVPFEPMQMFGDDGVTFVGIEMDLVRAVGERLGLEVKIADSSWDGLIPAMNSGRFDMLAASFGDFVERQEVVNMVDILNGNIAGLAKPDVAGDFATTDDLCGRSVGVENGSATTGIAQNLSVACTDAGKSAITQSVFPDDSAAVVALQSGRVDVVLDDMVVAQYLASRQSDRYSLVLPKLGDGFLYGFPIPKDEPEFAQLIADTVNELIADGTYAKICASYGIDGDSLLTESTVNGGTTSSADA